MSKNSTKNILTEAEFHLVAAFFGFLLGLLIFTFYFPNYYRRESPVKFVIEKGTPFSKVVDKLRSELVIPSSINMRIAAVLYGVDNQIKAGRYEIPNGLNYFDLLDLLTEGTPAEQKLVTIPEGIWQPELASLLMRELDIDSTEFMALSTDKEFLLELGINAGTIEGYLLPETYYFFTESSPEEVILKLKSEMDKLFDDAALERMRKLNFTKHQILTLASIIDGESNSVEEFSIISGVYHNRLRRRMMLQADPTIQYLIRNKKRNNRVLFKDLEINSPYNTYLYRGITPGPINNPGKEADHAALTPQENDVLYFFYTGAGKHKFSKSYTQHEKTVVR